MFNSFGDGDATTGLRYPKNVMVILGYNIEIIAYYITLMGLDGSGPVEISFFGSPNSIECSNCLLETLVEGETIPVLTYRIKKSCFTTKPITE